MIHFQFLYFGIIKKNLESETKELRDQMSKELELHMAEKSFRVRHYRSRSSVAPGDKSLEIDGSLDLENRQSKGSMKIRADGISQELLGSE